MAGNSVKNDTIVKGVFEDTNDRLSKKDACMLMALWMEMSPLAKIPQQPIKDSSECHEIKKVGVVVLDANGKLFASDFSHEFAHGVMSALFKHKQKLAGGIMFVSRKPCYDCTKHMIQAGIKTVYYFPVVPEVADKENLAVADHIFKVSHIAVKAFIPKVKKTRNHNSPFTKAVREDEIRKGKHKLEEFFGQDIIEENEYVLSDIQIPDTSTRNRRKEDFLEVMNWLARKAMGDVPSTLRIDYQANQYIPQTLKSILENQDFVRHAAAMTHILSHRTDDPETGVGAALISHTGDYLGFGYNGYQLDAEERLPWTR
ncbi:cytidine and dCMP deaminase domain-containing protein 1-like [Ptychodera flava]|uniref:cytidine and dCMP deaminase domain-containing protein 1-like n=1 Tax=Ptychodera flava TaxID=63121 RepID=UPI00396A9B3C